jgi:hypothetical protein
MDHIERWNLGNNVKNDDDKNVPSIKDDKGNNGRNGNSNPYGDQRRNSNGF